MKVVINGWNLVVVVNLFIRNKGEKHDWHNSIV